MFSTIEQSNLQSINPSKLKTVESMTDKQTIISSLNPNKSIESMSNEQTASTAVESNKSIESMSNEQTASSALKSKDNVESMTNTISENSDTETFNSDSNLQENLGRAVRRSS